jgi:hypothetical protein
MKLLYVFTSAGIKPSSVQTKVVNQINALNENGINCKGLFFTTDKFTSSDNKKEFEFISIPKVEQKYFKSIKKRKLCHESIYNFFQLNQLEFDLIYFRYDNASSTLSKFSKKYSEKIFFEHVTAETEEIKLYKYENPLRLKVSSILGNLEFLWLPLWRERIWGGSIRQHAAFGICNSGDIGEYEKKAAKGNYKIFIGGDAVKTDDYIVRKDIPSIDRELRIVFLKGASTAADFNGLDRIFQGISNYKGHLNIQLLLFGKNLDAESKMIRSLNISNHVSLGGYIKKEEIDALMPQIHIGIGAMGLHRKGIKSTTTIKSREYFAQGIPFIFGHHDPDISDSMEAGRYCMEFAANDEPIDFDKVINWYKELNKDKDYPERMRRFAEDFLDYKVKMRKLKLFLESINA